MKITVFGASGGIGTHVVDLATQRSHAIRAVYRATPPVPPTAPAEINARELGAGHERHAVSQRGQCLVPTGRGVVVGQAQD